MFLSLGGSRRRAQGQGDAQLQAGSSSLLLFQDLQNQGLLSRSTSQEDPLQALATGKYASTARASMPSCDETSLIRSKFFGEDSSPFAVAVSAGGCSYSSTEAPVQVGFSTTSAAACSPNSTLSYYLPSPNFPSLSKETSRVSSDSGASLPGGGEEAMSRDCEQLGSSSSRRSQTLDLAKKLKNSLGSKFADSLRETIKEVVMKQEAGKYDYNVWPALVQSLEDVEVSQSEAAGKPWDGNCWSVESKHTHVIVTPPPDHSSLLSFEAALPTLERSESSSLKRSFGGSGEHSKRLSWFSQENLSQSAIAELSWGTSAIRPAQVVSDPPSSSTDTDFLTSDMSLCAVLKESGAKESWADRSAMSRQLPRTVTRRHVFPEAGAMGICRPDSLLQQCSPNFRPRGEVAGFGRSKPSVGSLYNNLIKKADQSFLDVSKGFQSKDCESLLEFLNPGHLSNRSLREDARQRLYAKSAAKDSCESVHGCHENAFTSYNGASLLELPECGALGIEAERGVKRSRDDAAYASVQNLSKRQCNTGFSSLDAAPPIDGNGGAVKSDDPMIAGGFEEYLANLTASGRVPSYELPGSPLANLLEDFNHDSIVPIHLP